MINLIKRRTDSIEITLETESNLLGINLNREKAGFPQFWCAFQQKFKVQNLPSIFFFHCIKR